MRRYRTEYFDVPDASGRSPAARGYAQTLRGARRAIVVHMVLGDYKLGAVYDRHDNRLVAHMRSDDLPSTMTPEKEL